MADRMVRCPEGHFYDSQKHVACPWCAPPLDLTPADLQKTRAMPILNVPPPVKSAPPSPPSPAPLPAAPPSPVSPLAASPGPVPAPPFASPAPVASTPAATPPKAGTPASVVAPPPQAVPAPPTAAPPAAPPITAVPGRKQTSESETQRYGQSTKGVDPVVGWLVCLDGPDRGRDFRLKMERNFIGRSANMDICLVNDERVSRDRHASVVFDPKNGSFWLAPGESTGLLYLNGSLIHTPTQLKADDLIELGSTKLVLIPFCGDKYEWS